MNTLGGKRAFLGWVLGLALLITPLLGQTAEQELLKKVVQQHHKWVSLEANFVQQDYDEDFNLLNRAAGQVVFLKPGLMRWQYLPPEEQTIVVGKNKVWVYDPVLENVSIQKTEQVDGIGFLRTLAKNGNLTQRFKLLTSNLPTYKTAQIAGQKLLQPKQQQTLLHFQPKMADSGVQSLHLAVDKQTFIIQAFGLVDEVNAKRVILFSNMRLYEQTGHVNPENFVFLIPDGIDVIEK